MEKSIGAFWVQISEKGEFWTGYIEDEQGNKKNVVVFKNNYKKDKQPDYRVFNSRKKDEQEQTTELEEQPIMNDDDLPF